VSKKKIKVTLGLCVKNSEKTISFVMSSLLSQDYPLGLMELVVVDGYSKDGTISIIRDSLRGSKLSTTFLYENEGLGYARQLIVDNAAGDYIIWVDSDTVFPSDFVSKQVKFMDENPKVGIGRAMYGLLRGLNSVAFLENMPFVVESLRTDRAVPLGICGTEGAIFRVAAIKQAGGFDVHIRGACEDIDLAKRILSRGWLAKATSAVFYEICKESWKALFNQYVWWGRGGHYLFHKIRDSRMPFEMSPVGGFIAGILRFPYAFQLSKKKILLLLPFHYALKRVAYCYGFTKAHINGYGHDTSR
jgi:glycosyltransferase involved in cell wall biosynthesis